MVEAFEVEMRMPRASKYQVPSSAWLFAVRHEFSDMVGWDDARRRVWENWARAKGAYPFEVSRMDEAFGWLSLLRDHDAERRCLAAWALLTAKRASVRTFLQRRRWSRTTFYRRVFGGSDRIASVLDQRGVLLR